MSLVLIITVKGWFIDRQKYPPYTVLYHSGGGMGMHSLVAYIPEEKIGIVILTNTWGNKVPEVLYQRFFDLYLVPPSKLSPPELTRGFMS
ncbi:hypothetical protein Megvenef_01531 [Candidatus Megaera venefica]|uniref:Beta-lactamase-related domain-containing protein n=1 Tax=Candidatus Megaera venefica TaxID=2055910 RepID=A0ABU5NED9_9RICK|nr:hypothetical protein [Candidatus Megaera venefica]MEA0971551.1 hypothetical protein [Candidatus Megaera venefica]